MPLYDYECQSCGRRTELLQRFGDAPLAACPECGGAVRKLPSAPAVQFKGTGWYVTDYGRGGAGNGSKAQSESKDGSGAKDGPGAKATAGADKSTGEPAKAKSSTND